MLFVTGRMYICDPLCTFQTERQASVWLLQNLKEQCELLEIIFLYYRNVEHSPSSLLELATFFKVILRLKKGRNSYFPRNVKQYEIVSFYKTKVLQYQNLPSRAKFICEQSNIILESPSKKKKKKKKMMR